MEWNGMECNAMQAMFEVADMWVDSTDGPAYATFLWALLRAVAVEAKLDPSQTGKGGEEQVLSEEEQESSDEDGERHTSDFDAFAMLERMRERNRAAQMRLAGLQVSEGV